MKIKTMLGFCTCKGCMRRGIHQGNITAISKDGKEESWKIRLCKKHILDLTKEWIQRGVGKVERMEQRI